MYVIIQSQKYIIDFPTKGEQSLQAFLNTVYLKQDSPSKNYNEYKRDWPARKTATQGLDGTDTEEYCPKA